MSAGRLKKKTTVLPGTKFELCVVVGADVDGTDGGRVERERFGSVIGAVKYESHNKTI